MKVFLDANILFSAANPESPLRILLEDITRRGQVVTSAFAQEEARRNLEIKRPRWLLLLDSLISDFEVGVVPDRALGLSESDLPELETKDLPILTAAVNVRCTHLLMGDRRHFGSLFDRSVAGLKVVSPILLAKELENA